MKRWLLPLVLSAVGFLIPLRLTAQVLYSENFNDGLAAGRWNALEEGDNNTPDIDVSLAFNYSTLGIGAAPHGTGTIGAKLDTNISGAGGAEGVNIFPNGQSFSGDFVLRFDAWARVQGDPANSSEDYLGGINASGMRVNWLSIGSSSSDGVFYGASGDGGNINGFDYVRYVGNLNGDPTATPLHEHNDAVSQAAFPSSNGTPQNQWASFEVEQVNGVITWRMNGITFDKMTNTSAFTSGNIFLGHQDVVGLLTGNPDTFSIFDNVNVNRMSRWTGSLSSAWTSAANWAAPAQNNSDTIVYFGEGASVPHGVTLSNQQTMQSMVFDSSTAYTISGAGGITMLGNYGNARIDVRSGSHTIGVPVRLSSNLDINIAQAGDQLTLAGGLLGLTANFQLSKLGPGALEVKNVQGPGLTITGGVLRVGSQSIANSQTATSVVSKLSFAGTATAPVGQLDLTDEALIINYTSTSPLTDVRQWLRAGLISGSGIVSSLRTTNLRLGYFDTATRPTPSFGGFPIDSTSVAIGYSYAGDANMDGKVDVNDLYLLATHWLSSGYWSDGDFNYDGTINGQDLGLLGINWQAGTNGLPISLSQALDEVGLNVSMIPEPSFLSAAAMLLLAARRRNRIPLLHSHA